jgi:DNA-binding CsgD family transcriptional regulator
VQQTRASGTLEAIQRALEVLLAPSEYPDWRSWRRDVHQRLLELTGAERMAIYTPLGSDTEAWCVPGLTAEWGSMPHPEPGSAGTVRRLSGFVAAQSTGGFDRRDGAPPRHQDTAGALARRHRTSAVVTGSLHSQTAPRAEIAAIEVDFGGERPAMIAFTDGRSPWWRPDAERVASLKAVLPALKAGLAMWRKTAEQKAALPAIVQALSGAAILFDRGGTLLHANDPARALLASDAGARLRGEAQRLAWTVDASARRSSAAVGLPTATRDLRLDATCYRMRGVVPPETLRGSAGAILVTIERIERAPLSDQELRERFGLTAREVEVTRLVAQGLSNQEIADRLGVSFFTARNHVERLLVKLGVANRARVAVVLSGETAE